MKTIPPPCPVPDTGPKYWRSMDQLADTPEFRQWAEREFPSGASELNDPVTRRSFVKLMGASFLLAGFGLTGCRRPVEKIYPFSKMPEGYVHGVAKYYATAMPTRRSAIPLLAKSNDGRPTKLEGNPLPETNGGTDRYTQASILDLYDPDRAQRFAKNNSTITKTDVLTALAEISKQAQGNGGAGLCFLAGQTGSPSRLRLQQELAKKFPQAGWYEYEPVDFDVHRQAATEAFGKPVAPYYKMDVAKVIVSLDCDFIGAEENAYQNILRFAKGRKMRKNTDSMSRLYTVEGLMTLTGVNSDHRLRIAPSLVPAVAARMAAEVMKQTGQGGVGNNVEESSKAIASYEKWIVECAKDLLSNRGQCLVVAGHKQPLAVHVMANAMNAALGNIGKTVLMLPAEQPKVRSIADLAGALNDGKVDTLVILGGNPVYNAPVDLNWAAAQAKAKTVVRLGYYEDESFPQSGWALPMAHYLESWGDARTADGTLVPIQPLILPLFDGMTELELIARIAGMDVTSPYEIVRETFRGIAGKSEEDWKTFLHDGYLANSAAKPVDVQLNARATNGSIGPVTAPTKDSLEVIFHRDYKMDDGRFNNNGWLQELPDPISKMTWENVIMMSIATAKQLGVYAPNPENNRMLAPWVKLELNGRQVEGPVWSQPGQADNTIGLALGYGRQKTGRVGINSGYDAYKLRTTTALYIAPGAKLTKTGKKHAISPTQDHGAMEGRPVIREATLEEYREHPTFATLFNMEEPPTGNVSLYPNPLDAVKSDRHQWAMSIDLNSCVGCATCVMACQSENNIPIVGKEQVSNNREMHWIRIDRYFTGSPDREDEIQAVNQPMLCQHCEAAPCENVCPVNATVHDQEGLNVMAYNRCVGTRYCSNNCPYKVRRFNFFDYNRRTFAQLQSPYTTPLFPTRGQNSVLDWLKDPDRGSQPTDQWELLKLVKNPDVTVRMRGVMEKCSYCVQRIEAAKITAKVKAGASDDVRVPTDSFKTACQQACPADAIVFGNLLDEQSKIVERKANDRNYRVLDFLNTRPRTTYLARVRNPNPAMPDAYKTPHSTEEYIKENHNLYDEGGQPVPAARKEKPSIGEPEKGAL